jgi:hypothetical protein
MVKKIFICLFIFFPVSVFSQELIITEVQVGGDSPDSSYIKIYNQGEKNIDVSNFKIIKKSSTGKEYSVRVFPKNTFIQPKEYFTWANSKDNYHLYVDADVYSSTKISLNNSVALISKDSVLIDAVGWGNGKNQFFLGKIISLNPKNKEIIKRKKINNIYQQTNNNDNDFFFFQEDKELTSFNYFKKNDFLNQNKKIPFRETFSISVVFSFLILIFNKNINYGRS